MKDILNKFKIHLWQYFPVYLFLFSWLIRLVYTFEIRGMYDVWEGDEGIFARLAKRLVAGEGYTSTARMPFVPYLASFYIRLFGDSTPGLHVFSSFLGAFIPLTLYFCAQYITKNKLIAVISSLYAAIYPYFLHQASMLDTENGFIPLTIILFTLIYAVLKNPQKIWLYPVIGIIYALSCLARPTNLILPALLFIYLLLKRWSFKDIFLKWGLTLITAAICIAPWSYFVSTRLGHFVLLMEPYDSLIGSTNRTTMFDPEMSGHWQNLERDFPEVIEEFTLIPGSKTFDSGAIEYIYVARVLKKYWYRIPFLTVNKCKALWSYSPKHPTHRNFRDDLTGLLFYGILLPFFFIALVEYKDRLLVENIILHGVLLTIMAIISSGCTRFRLPLDPFIILLVTAYLIPRFKKL